MPEPLVISPIGLPFIELSSVDSTNNYALSRVHAGLAQHGTVFFAHEQVAGKGQRGKHWSSERNANIMMSILLKPAGLLLSQQFHLSATVAVAIQHFFQQYAGDATKIKWPNDLYWQDRKAGGILIESVIGQSEPVKNTGLSAPQWQWAVIGIGININQTRFPSDLKNPVSLLQITGKKSDPVILGKMVCDQINLFLDILQKEGYQRIYELYQSVLYKKNEIVKFKKQNRVFDAIVKGITPGGRLIISHAIEEEVDFGEVEWVIS